MTVVQQRVPQEPAAWPHQVGVIPSRARSFQHRAEADRLRAAVEGGGTAVLSQVLTGMGGVGKTQLAADYARAAWADGNLDVLVWVTASAQSPVVTGYAQAGVELCRADPDDPEQAAKTFLAWLAPKAGQRPCRWLIVLDDVADPNDLVVNPDDPDTGYSLWPPDSPYGRTLVTTRRRDAALFGEGRCRIEVGLFTEAEAAAYLTASLAAQGRVEPADQVAALAAELGRLALALAQAAAYLIDSGETVAAYRDLLADCATMLIELAPDALPDEQAVALAAAWSLSIARADTLRPAGLARPMLHLAALLDANGIPQEVLTGEVACAHLTAHRTVTGPNPAAVPASVSRRDAVRALRALDRLSLIDHMPGTPHQAVRIHQLIQRATRDTLTSDQRDQYARTAADALMAAWPVRARGTALSLTQTLLANVDALTGNALVALWQPDTHPLLFEIGFSLGSSGRATAAVRYFRRLTESAGYYKGPDHLDTLTARAHLAWWRGEAGDAAGAADAHAELLQHAPQVVGPDHHGILTTRAHFAHWRERAGDLAGAADAFAELLADRNRVLGPDHPDTLDVRGELARLRGTAGDPAGAADALAGLLEHALRVLGPDHSGTLNTWRNLARWREEAGDAAGAATAFAELFEHAHGVLGSTHFATKDAWFDLARLWEKAGGAAGAAPPFAELVERAHRVLGPDHVAIVDAWRNIARWREEGTAATPAEALADRERFWGRDHPETFVARASLAQSRGEAGDASGAVAAFAELLALHERELGADHPETLATRHSLALWQGKAGDPAGAADALAELLADQGRELGADHPETLATRHSLAHWQGEAGDPAGAAAVLAELLEHVLQVVGPDHYGTLTTRQSLAYWRGQARDKTVRASGNDRS
ncbi:tetratricopeptide repeat protein [Streptomyces sp. NBC_01604]|uniref:tetratricopeptide repeat protein n=1 Tax=Streptomyces sp. NBC_01604 TaxID=2975894 RepID=UPI00386FB649